jgi:hypothetical protein
LKKSDPDPDKVVWFRHTAWLPDSRCQDIIRSCRQCYNLQGKDLLNLASFEANPSYCNFESNFLNYMCQNLHFAPGKIYSALTLILLYIHGKIIPTLYTGNSLLTSDRRLLFFSVINFLLTSFAPCFRPLL